jgi:hypothetical protein
MKVHVEVEAAAEPLHEHNGPALGSHMPSSSRSPLIRPEDGLHEQTCEGSQHRRFQCRQHAKLVGKREHVLPEGHVGQHAVHKVGPGVCHAPPGAAWAYAPVLAREGHEQVMAAVVAVRAYETVREHAASKVGAKLALHVGRKWLVVRLGRVAKERRKVSLHNSVERSLRWPPRRVCCRKGSHESPRAAKRMPGRPLSTSAALPSECPGPATWGLAWGHPSQPRWPPLLRHLGPLSRCGHRLRAPERHRTLALRLCAQPSRRRTLVRVMCTKRASRAMPTAARPTVRPYQSPLAPRPRGKAHTRASGMPSAQ